jgi:hypothetical protein
MLAAIPIASPSPTTAWCPWMTARGGIYSLARISKESPDDCRAVMNRPTLPRPCFSCCRTPLVGCQASAAASRERPKPCRPVASAARPEGVGNGVPTAEAGGPPPGARIFSHPACHRSNRLCVSHSARIHRLPRIAARFPPPAPAAGSRSGYVNCTCCSTEDPVTPA